MHFLTLIQVTKSKNNKTCKNVAFNVCTLNILLVYFLAKLNLRLSKFFDHLKILSLSSTLVHVKKEKTNPSVKTGGKKPFRIQKYFKTLFMK